MAHSLEFLAGGGRMGALMRAHDWSSSPLGPPDVWPQSLRTVVALLLQSQFPMFVAWGDALGFLYNDSYAEILGAKHPRALGSRFYDIWSEIWPDISPLVDAAMAGQATYREDLLLVMNRKGYDEETTLEQRTRIFDGMRRAVARGTGLTRQLLAFSRRRPLNPESLDLPAHLQGMREMPPPHQRPGATARPGVARSCWSKTTRRSRPLRVSSCRRWASRLRTSPAPRRHSARSPMHGRSISC
jgi:hypothetical protein